MTNYRVSFTRVTLEYYEVDVTVPEWSDDLKPNEDWARLAAQEKFYEEPARYQLASQDHALIVTDTRRL